MNIDLGDLMLLLLWLGAISVVLLLACALEALFFKSPKSTDKLDQGE